VRIAVVEYVRVRDAVHNAEAVGPFLNVNDELGVYEDVTVCLMENEFVLELVGVGVHELDGVGKPDMEDDGVDVGGDQDNDDDGVGVKGELRLVVSEVVHVF
jgi:hypothetical protein